MARFVLFHLIKKCSLNLLCVLDLFFFSERWQSTRFQIFFPHTSEGEKLFKHVNSTLLLRLTSVGRTSSEDSLKTIAKKHCWSASNTE